MLDGQATRDFDQQARYFDLRAGLPPAACDSIALALLRTAPVGPADLLLEIGAGTGQIGSALCTRPVRYLGIDASHAMLSEFARRCRRDGRAAPIAVADAQRTWPVRDGSATLVFGSRSLHLLPLSHVLREAIRVASPKRTYVVIGRVERDPGSLRARLRRAMLASLIRRGDAPARGRQRGQELLDAFLRLGALEMRPRVVASWSTSRSARQIIEAWRVKPGLAGVDLPPSDKEALLFELTGWAKRAIGSLDRAETSEERYVLAGVRLAARSLAQATP